ncbi:hypothetical protein LTR85_001891 [Meristemomyces frigidus]|nr:hypothetical protein LTR85_001891 [Meristemomyces frigidus]
MAPRPQYNFSVKRKIELLKFLIHLIAAWDGDPSRSRFWDRANRSFDGGEGTIQEGKKDLADYMSKVERKWYEGNGSRRATAGRHHEVVSEYDRLMKVPKSQLAASSKARAEPKPAAPADETEELELSPSREESSAAEDVNGDGRGARDSPDIPDADDEDDDVTEQGGINTDVKIQLFRYLLKERRTRRFDDAEHSGPISRTKLTGLMLMVTVGKALTCTLRDRTKRRRTSQSPSERSDPDSDLIDAWQAPRAPSPRTPGSAPRQSDAGNGRSETAEDEDGRSGAGENDEDEQDGLKQYSESGIEGQHIDRDSDEEQDEHDDRSDSEAAVERQLQQMTEEEAQQAIIAEYGPLSPAGPSDDESQASDEGGLDEQTLIRGIKAPSPELSPSPEREDSESVHAAQQASSTQQSVMSVSYSDFFSPRLLPSEGDAKPERSLDIPESAFGADEGSIGHANSDNHARKESARELEQTREYAIISGAASAAVDKSERMARLEAKIDQLIGQQPHPADSPKRDSKIHGEPRETAAVMMAHRTGNVEISGQLMAQILRNAAEAVISSAETARRAGEVLRDAALVLQNLPSAMVPAATASCDDAVS